MSNTKYSVQERCKQAMEVHKESWDDVIHISMNKDSKGFTVWTHKRIYFTISYDSGWRRWIQSISRDPSDEDCHVET